MYISCTALAAGYQRAAIDSHTSLYTVHTEPYTLLFHLPIMPPVFLFAAVFHTLLWCKLYTVSSGKSSELMVSHLVSRVM